MAATPADARSVTCFLRHEGAVLLVGGADGWDAVTAPVGDHPDAAARRAVADVTGLDPHADVTLVRAGDPVTVSAGGDGERVVHPYLFDCERRDLPAAAPATREWASPAELRRRETVPGLWAAYDRVRPRVETVASDREHGAAALSLRALAVLRDEAAARADEGGDAWPALAGVARDLRSARPSMPVVANRVNRAMAAASEARTAGAVVEAAAEGLDRARRADEAAASAAADFLAGTDAATLSRSGTVRRAVAGARPPPDSLLVAASRPGGEGRWTAERLADVTDVTLTTDAAFGAELAARDVDVLVVGADAVLADGRVVNKVGTRAAATVARREGAAVYAVAASDKVRPGTAVHEEARDPAEVYDGDADVAVANPTFDATPAALVDAVLTERGALDTEAVRDLAREHRDLADWPAE